VFSLADFDAMRDAQVRQWQSYAQFASRLTGAGIGRRSDEWRFAYAARKGGDDGVPTPQGKRHVHWCANCSNWPTSNYDQQSNKPRSGELCNECQAKQKAGTCR
jgi:hypothetical protein